MAATTVDLTVRLTMLLSEYVKDVMLCGCFGELLIPDDVALLFFIHSFTRPVDLSVSIKTDHVLVNRDQAVGPYVEWTSTYVFTSTNSDAHSFCITRKACFDDLPVSGYSGTGHNIDKLLSVSWQLKFETVVCNTVVFNTCEFEELLYVLTKDFD